MTSLNSELSLTQLDAVTGGDRVGFGHFLSSILTKEPKSNPAPSEPTGPKDSTSTNMPKTGSAAATIVLL